MANNTNYTNWVGTDLGIPPPKKKKEYPGTEVGTKFGGGVFNPTEVPGPEGSAQLPWNFTTGQPPAPAIKTGAQVAIGKPISVKGAEMTTEGATQPQAAQETPPPTAIPEAQGTPAAPPPAAKGGINYSLDAAGNVVASAIEGKENPNDKRFQDTLDKIEQLSGMIVPAKSGLMGDTYQENIDTISRIKALEKNAALLRPNTTEGMNLPGHMITANAGAKPLDPTTMEVNRQHALLLEAQRLNAMPKENEKEMAELAKTDEEARKMAQGLMEADNTLKADVALARARSLHKPRVKHSEVLTANDGKTQIRINTMVGGAKEYFDEKTGKPFAAGVPTK